VQVRHVPIRKEDEVQIVRGTYKVQIQQFARRSGLAASVLS
jgi:hypothetical protein